MKSTSAMNQSNQPALTHCDLTAIQICVPSDWPIDKAIQFAETTSSCLLNHHWTVPHEMTKLEESPACGLRPGFVHVIIYAEPFQSADHIVTINESILIETRRVDARVIINLASTTAQDLHNTAQNLDLLAQYLRLKAMAKEASANDLTMADSRRHETDADHLHSRLLAQFPGTLVFS